MGKKKTAEAALKPEPEKEAAPAQKGLVDAAERDAWIEREYRLGQLKIAEMSRQSGLSRQAIIKRARKNGWDRDLLPAVQAKVRDGLLRDAAPEGALPEEQVEAAAARAVEAVRQHRTSLRRLNLIATQLMNGLELHLNGKLPIIPWMRPTDTVASVVLRVAQALAKIVPLERQALSIGAGASDEPPEQGPPLPDWRTLFERAGIRARSGPDAGTG